MHSGLIAAACITAGLLLFYINYLREKKKELDALRKEYHLQQRRIAIAERAITDACHFLAYSMISYDRTVQLVLTILLNAAKKMEPAPPSVAGSNTADNPAAGDELCSHYPKPEVARVGDIDPSTAWTADGENPSHG